MSLILTIDCSGLEAYVCLAENGKILAAKQSNVQKEHASFLHEAIEEVCKTADRQLKNLKAVSVADGPGSYTGLRVAMASAKGLCYALKVPLLTYHNLYILALAASKQISLEGALIIPMIDARRMEVFTATYTSGLKEVETGRSLIITEESFLNEHSNSELFFCGDANQKVKEVIRNKNAHYVDLITTMEAAAEHSFSLYNVKDFKDLNYTVPYYIKPFFTG